MWCAGKPECGLVWLSLLLELDRLAVKLQQHMHA
jgi:hypothetical protein